jgi:hypothetical protein
MDGSPRASHLIELCEALQIRIRFMRKQVAEMAACPDRDDLIRRIGSARMHLGALHQELAIARFVEDSVRVTLHQERPNLDDDDEDE